jgi:pimeloyl-ACP methyl ester carboxylesterase
MDRYIRVDDGAELFLQDTGAGPALLLLHGLTGTHDDFGQVFDLVALRRKWRVIAPDARGHGRSTNPRREFSIHLPIFGAARRVFAAHTARWLDA